MAPRNTQLPTQEEIIKFLERMEGQPASKRDIAKHFNIKGSEPRIELRNLLKNMAAEGLLMPEIAKSYSLPKDAKSDANTPRPLELKAVGLNDDGEIFCEVTNHKLKGQFPLIIADNKSGVGVGDIFKAILEEFAPGEFMAHSVVKEEEKEHESIMGVYKENHRGAMFIPLQKELQSVKFAIRLPLPESLAKTVKEGAVILGKPSIRPEYGPTPIDVLDFVRSSIHGMEEELAIKNFDLPHTFPKDVLKETDQLKDLQVKDLGGREDLRHIPLVTIDGEDSKDFDDAVWSEPWEVELGDNVSDKKALMKEMKSSKTKAKGENTLSIDSATTSSGAKGHHIIVAIADVAYYVQNGTQLDKEAFERGNSVYFPKSVIPMLPERISNDLCSLNPNVDRPAMVAHLYIDAKGKLRKHHFTRAFIKSHARLTYTNVQKAINGEVEDVCKEVLDSTIKPLYAAYKSLLKNRSQRGALDLEFPEKYIEFDESGKVSAIKNRERHDSHRLIEEMMVLANVAAATTLQSKGAPCLYRIHPEPGQTKLTNLQAALKPFNLRLDFSNGITPKRIQGLIRKVENSDDKEALHYMVLRSQEQAKYDPENVGHFGLALQRYAHFTSPIRRYSDLVVHRSLIKTLKLTGHEKEFYPVKLEGVGEHLCITERRAQKAEWEVRDRLTTEFYEQKIGSEFVGKINTITSFGMFITIDGGMAEGLLPLRTMDDDHYILDEETNTLRGRRNRKTIRIGDEVKVKLTEADLVCGRLAFAPAESSGSRPPRRGGRDSGRGDYKDRKDGGRGGRSDSRSSSGGYKGKRDSREGDSKGRSFDKPRGRSDFRGKSDDRPHGDKPRSDRPRSNESRSSSYKGKSDSRNGDSRGKPFNKSRSSDTRNSKGKPTYNKKSPKK